MTSEALRQQRVRSLAALADPARLAVVDELVLGDRSPGELAASLGLSSNLLAHHLKVLAEAGLVRRLRSEADGRRSYVQLVGEALGGLIPAPARLAAPRVLFVCTQNSARSQLARALWRTRSTVPATCGGTSPAPRIHPGALAVARRNGLRLERRAPVHVSAVRRPSDLVVSVCDSADEELRHSGEPHLHWSIADPVPAGTSAAFDRAFAEVAERVADLAQSVDAPDSGSR